MRILYTTNFDEETTDYFIIINSFMAFWIAKRIPHTHNFTLKYLSPFENDWIDDSKTFSSSDAKNLFEAPLDCYIIKQKDYDMIDKFVKKYGRKHNFIQRIKDSLVETKTIY